MATETVQLKVSGLMCSFCTMSLETALKRNAAIRSVLVNLVHGIVLVEADTAVMSRADVAAAIERLGYSVSSTTAQQTETDDALHALIKQRGAIGLALSIAVLLLDTLDLVGLPAWARALVSLVVAAFVLLWVGFPILKKTLLAIRGRVINANVLLSAGAWGSFVVGVVALFDPRWPNFLPVASWLMALHLFFGYFKLDTRKKASEAVRKLLSLQPPRARVRRGDEVVEVATGDVRLGEILEVRPGDRIALDGEIVEGAASVDESSFTGESVPAAKTQGATVIGGTLALDGALRVRVTKLGEDGFLSQVVRLMTQIAEKKPPLELLADRLMNFYGPVVFVVALGAFAAWVAVTGDAQRATVVLVTTVIMGYPCALGITTPMLAAIAGGRGIAIGLLVKANEVFHELARVDTVVFDKTGTLTYGRPTVVAAAPWGAASTTELLAAAAAVESVSEHPVGQAIGFYAKREGVTSSPAADFRAVIGNGVVGRVGGAEVVAGKPSFLVERGAAIPAELTAAIDAAAAEGQTVVVVSRAGVPLGHLALQDTPRRSAEVAIRKLRARGVRTVMLTGDSFPVARAIGAALGIDDVRAELLPADKAGAVAALQREGRVVAMVGDGINDAPALAQADVGMALGAGTDVAVESAGVILVGDRLDDVAGALVLGRAAARTMQGNVAIAVLCNVGGVGLAAAGWVTPLLAVGVMIASIFAILVNTLRIRSLDLGRDEVSARDVPLAEIELFVAKMVCEGCAETIGARLQGVPGVRAVRSKIPAKRVVIQFEPRRVEEGELRRILAESGFEAVPA